MPNPVEAASDLEFLNAYLLNEQRKRVTLRAKHRKIDSYYPDEGPLRRELYPVHMQFFAAGGKHEISPACPAGCDGSPHMERCFLAANRVGKTEGVGSYEMALHLTGDYPVWWPGRRFDHATRCWAAGDTSKTVHVEILQPKLLGMPGSFGTGMIPGDRIKDLTRKVGMPDAIETIYVYHTSPTRNTTLSRGVRTREVSVLTLKSYEQGRESFQGTEKDVIWLDEECDRDIYTECLLRLLATVPGQPNGLMILTFTPLEGMTDIVRDFLGMNESVEKGQPGSPEMENFGTPAPRQTERRKDS